MILVDFSKIAHWESAGGKVNFQVIAVLNWRGISNTSPNDKIPKVLSSWIFHLPMHLVD